VNDTFKINVDRVNFEYFRLEVYERIQLSAFDFELTKLDLESVNVNLEQITFTTKQKDISTVQAYLLPIRNLATSGVNVKVNSDNVGNFLQLYDIFDNEVIFLNAGDLNGS
jgi:CRISPR/Cas system-associated endoribonuclease Cas2